MAEVKAKPELSQHMSNVETNVETVGGEAQEVFNVALADALARDNTSAWSPSMIKLYAIIGFATLGKWTLSR